MGAWPRSPRFLQYLAQVSEKSRSRGAPPGVQRLVYVLSGSLRVDDQLLEPDGFAWLPPDEPHALQGKSPGTVLVFEKPYAPLPEAPPPRRLIGHLASAPVAPFLGDEAARLATLLPVTPHFDMAVNVFTFDPGATLPLVESHVMEHGLYMRSGQGIYRLAQAWYPVQAGDSIWMAAYCPQWFVAMGKQAASYIYYKDIHRDPLRL